MNNLDLEYQNILRKIIDTGYKKGDRTGTGTISVFGTEIRHKMSDGFPLLTTKKMAWKPMVTELIWFLKGDTNIKYLLDNNCNIWVGDCYKKYEKSTPESERLSESEFIEKIKTDEDFSKEHGNLGPVYGLQWRAWKSFAHEYGENEEDGNFVGMWTGDKKIDQIANLINDLKTTPDSRRLMVSAWNVAELKDMTLPPCHFGFQCYTRDLNCDERMELYLKNPEATPIDDFGIGQRENEEELAHQIFDSYSIPKKALSLKYNCRSQDFALGTPFNIASYGLLLMIIAKQVNMMPDELIGSFGDTHLYSNHIDGALEQLKREPFQLPTLKISDKKVNDISEYELGDFELIGYQSHPKIFFPLSN